MVREQAQWPRPHSIVNPSIIWDHDTDLEHFASHSSKPETSGILESILLTHCSLFPQLCFHWLHFISDSRELAFTARYLPKREKIPSPGVYKLTAALCLHILKMNYTLILMHRKSCNKKIHLVITFISTQESQNNCIRVLLC